VIVTATSSRAPVIDDLKVRSDAIVIDEWAALQLPDLADLMRGAVRLRAGRPTVFSGVGMAWQDLVVASLIYERHGAGERNR
jgi:ornithine cyclodeaminase/alanine dehydrogenase-like protein (mu-crystallin family)